MKVQSVFRRIVKNFSRSYNFGGSELKHHVKRFSRSAWIVGLLAGLTGCGGSENQVPTDLEIRLSQDEQTWKIDNADGCGREGYQDYYSDHYIQATLVSGSGSPLGEIDVSFRLDLAGNTYSGGPVLFLYEDVNSNGVIDGADNYVSNNQSGVYVTRSDEFQGTANVLVRMVLSCTYSGTLQVYAGGQSASVDFEVELDDEAQPSTVITEDELDLVEEL